MYTRQEASQLRQQFWTAFGLYMQPVVSADGEKVSWTNYKTGKKYVVFKIEAGNNLATVSLEINHPDEVLRKQYFGQLELLKPLFETHAGRGWLWQPEVVNEHGKVYSQVIASLAAVSVLRREDWPALISFFKPRIMGLDAFWSEARYYFEALP